MATYCRNFSSLRMDLCHRICTWRLSGELELLYVANSDLDLCAACIQKDDIFLWKIGKMRRLKKRCSKPNKKYAS